MNKEILLNTFLTVNSLNILTEAVSAAFDCPVIITDNGFHIISAFAAADYDDAAYRKAVSHSELSLDACTEITNCINKADGNHIWQNGGKKYLVSELDCGEITLGYIIYVLDNDKFISEKDRIFAESLIAKQFYSERHAGGVASDTAEEILIDLLDGKFSDESVFRLKASGTFLAHFHPERFALIDFSSNNADNSRGNHLKQSFARNFHASHPFIYDRNIILFLHEDHDISLMRSLVEEYGLKAVVSENIDRLYAIRTAYIAAHDTLLYLLKKNSDSFFADCDDYALLMLISRIEKQSGFADAKIKQLYEYDAKNGTELCLTLYTYMCCKHSLQETADALFTHRNTVQYRIRKIREEFSIDTDNSKKHLRCLVSLAVLLKRQNHDELFIK